MPDEKKYYLVRSPHDLMNDRAVGIGWGGIRFEDFKDIDALLEEVGKTGWLGRRSSQLRHFKAIKKGDVILVPLPWHVAIGVATGEEKYDEKFVAQNACNQKSVEFLKDAQGKVRLIPRTEFQLPLQSRLKIRITVADLTGFAEDIENVKRRTEAGTSRQDEAMLKEQEEGLRFREVLLENIRSGKNTYLEAGGAGLENLVKELLLTSGYSTAEISGKRAYKGAGDADVVASRLAWPCDELLLVQVKHHQGTTGTWAMSQLKEIRETMEGYGDHQLVVVTTGVIRPEDRAAAGVDEIDVVDGQELVQWIYESIPKLRPETRAKLGISEVPRFVAN